MDTEEKKNTWGGSRGGGRPTAHRTVPLCIRISQESMDKLNSLTSNKSEFLDILIRKL